MTNERFFAPLRMTENMLLIIGKSSRLCLLVITPTRAEKNDKRDSSLRSE
ncbi:MAG: hypothetical protein KDC42_08415 [Ignavibacteriae bacterium]|nr:hypothetical protein [Ignavibacteriota bacterium]